MSDSVAHLPSRTRKKKPWRGGTSCDGLEITALQKRTNRAGSIWSLSKRRMIPAICGLSSSGSARTRICLGILQLRTLPSASGDAPQTATLQIDLTVRKSPSQGFMLGQVTGDSIRSGSAVGPRHSLTCLKYTLPRMLRPHFPHRLITRTCFRYRSEDWANSLPASRTKSIVLSSQSRVSRLKES